MNMNKIMIVEDESLVGMDIQNNLEDLGYNVTSVHAEAQSALTKIPIEFPDLVIIDIKLQGEMDGIAAARIVLDNFNIPVLFLTAYADKEIIDRAREVGAYGYMIKPFSNNDLRAMVAIAISKHQLDQEKNLLDDRLRKAHKNEVVRNMAGGLAHRLNNSLQVVLGNLSLATSTINTDEKGRGILLDAVKAAENSAELGRQLLACSGHGFLIIEEKDLNETILQTMRTLEKMLPQDVKLVLDLAEDLPAAQLDGNHLDNVIIALMTNAVESMDTGKGTITIKTWIQDHQKNYLKNVRLGEFLKEGLYICFSVKDTGCGMDESTKEKMFDPFFSTKFTGRGLSLAASLGIVQSHGGTVDVITGPEEGTTVEVLFPILREAYNDPVSK